MLNVTAPLTLQAFLKLPPGVRIPRPKGQLAGFPPQARLRWA